MGCAPRSWKPAPISWPGPFTTTPPFAICWRERTWARGTGAVFYTVLRAVYGKCVLLSADDRLENLLILFPPNLKSVPTLAFFRRGGGKLRRHFGPGLYVRPLRYEAHCGRIREK